MEKYKTIWIKIEDVKNIELNALQVYDDRYMKYKTRTYGDEVYTNFQGLDVSEHEVGCKSFTVILYWFITCLWHKIWHASILRQLCSWSCTQPNNRLSWWQSFWGRWRLDLINDVLQ